MWRCRDRLSLSSAWLAPMNRGSLNSTLIHGTHVPVEEPSTASETEVASPRIAPHALAGVGGGDCRELALEGRGDGPAVGPSHVGGGRGERGVASLRGAVDHERGARQRL